MTKPTYREQIHQIEIAPSDGGYRLIVLDPVRPGFTPDYCVHGKATCVGGCGRWLYLGSETVKEVQLGDVLPVCPLCAVRMISPEHQAPIGHIDDHLREDGPHE